MSKVPEHLRVTVRRADAVITRTGFGIPLIFDTSAKITGDYQQFASLAAVLEVFVTTDAAYKAAKAIFDQSPSVNNIIIAKRAANVAQVNTVTVTAADLETVCTIDGTAYTGNAGGGVKTVIAIATEIHGLINADAGATMTSVDGLDGTFTVTSDVVGDPHTVVGTTNCSVVEDTANKNVATEIARIQESIDTWYFVTLVNRSTEAEQLQDILQMAEWVETQTKFYVTSNDQASMITAVDTDIASLLQDAEYERTAIMYNTSHEEDYPECRWIGKVAPYPPGKFTWKFLTLVGLTPDTLTLANKTNLKAKNCNFYETIAGVDSVTSKGVNSNRTFIDLVIATDWLQVTVGEDLLALLLAADKVPFTEQGLAQFEATILSTLNQAVTNGILIDGSQAATVPALSEISAADIQSRTLSGATFSGDFVQSIHEGDILGDISLSPAA